MANTALALLLVSLASPRPVVVVVGPAAGAGARARAQVEAALSREEGLAVGSLRGWLEAARAAGIRRTEARSRAAVAHIAGRAGVDAVVVLSVRGREPRLRLRVELVDARGKTRWTSTYPLGQQGITQRRRSAVARSVAEAMRRPQLGMDLTPRPRLERPLSAPVPPAQRAPSVSPPRAERPTPPPPRVERPPYTAARTAEGRADDPALRVELGMPVTWRKASLSPDSGPGFEYRSADPYFGVAFDLRLAPLRVGGEPAGPTWLQPIEFDLGLSYSFASTRLSDGRTIGSGEQRAGLDLLYPWTLPTKTRLALRAGFALHRFAIDPNDVAPTSLRTGVRLGLDLRQPFGSRWAVDAGVRVYPISGPGSDELARFGPGGSGWGYEIVAGLEGPFPFWRRLSWRLGYDLLHFSDSYSGAGSASSGGSGASTYHSGSASLVYSM
jgi:hypothetical protein